MYERFQEIQSDGQKREELIQEFNDFLDQRETLIKQVSKSQTDEEKQLSRDLISVDQKLQNIAQEYFNSFKIELGSFKQKKAHNKKYINPYQQLYGNGGAYLDHKK